MNDIQSDTIDTVKACLIACGGSEDESLLERQCNAAGSKPSDFVRQVGGRLLALIIEWDAAGRNGHSLPVIPVELIWDIEQILAGDSATAFYPRIEQ